MPAPSSANGTLRQYCGIEAVVERYAGVWSRWTLYEKTRLSEIPHRKLPGRRELIFLPDELDAWEDGAELQVIQLPRGGRVVRPVRSAS